MRLGCMTKSIEEMETQIETLVREHITACRKAAGSAVERAFGSTPKRSTTRTTGTAPRTSGGSRRSAEEMSGLGERLFDAVRANPGAGMTMLMVQVGSSARDLHRPMMLLKNAGRVRSVGQRGATRYFPMAESA